MAVAGVNVTNAVVTAPLTWDPSVTASPVVEGEGGADGEEGAEDGAMGPEGTGCDKSTSEEVHNVMPPPVEAAPILKPEIVTVKTGPAGMAPIVVVMTMAGGEKTLDMGPMVLEP